MARATENFDPTKRSAGIDIVGEDLLPFGSECVVDGLMFPCYTSCSSTTSITPNTLVTMLGSIDARGMMCGKKKRAGQAACDFHGWLLSEMLKPVVPTFSPSDDFINARGDVVIPLLVPAVGTHPTSRHTRPWWHRPQELLEDSIRPIPPGYPRHLRDTSEQNGSFGPALVKAKADVLPKKNCQRRRIWLGPAKGAEVDENRHYSHYKRRLEGIVR